MNIKEKRESYTFDDKYAYLKLILDGKVKLYEYEFNNSQNDINSRQLLKESKNYFYIEINNELILINNLLYKKSWLKHFLKSNISF